MPLSFNNAGPQQPGLHYTLDPLRRINFAEIQHFIQQQRYFVLHAPRQTGKTSCLLAIRDKLNDEGTYRALYVNIEAAKAVPEEQVQTVMTEAMAVMIDETFPEADGFGMLVRAKEIAPQQPFPQIVRLLCQADKTRPLVLFIDEADTLPAQSTVTYLSQLRSGYSSRPKGFPASIILCGLKDIRDFRITDAQGNHLTTGSAFNILSDSLTLGNFSREEVHELYAQHTAATGQICTHEAVDLVFDLTFGQPWMVNKLGDIACFGNPEARDRSRVITPEIITAAREEMIRRRVIHLDNLAYRLSEERVRRVIAPMISGDDAKLVEDSSDDIRYCLDLGLVRRDEQKNLVIANPIYREIIPRELTAATQMTLKQDAAWYREADGSMNLPKLLRAFFAFFKASGEHDRFFPKYSEAGVQLLLQAWLQRIVNGGGQIEREYSLGSQRVDLLVRWPYPQPLQEMVIEMKVVRDKSSPETVLAEGLEQIQSYMQRVSATEGHLLIFDQRKGQTWDAKFYEKPAATPDGRKITLWGG